jgi:hypothetical protein
METPNAVVIPQLAALTANGNETNTELDFTKFNAEKMLSFVVNYNPKIGEMPGYRHSVIRYRVVENKTTPSAKVDKPAKMVTIPSVTFPDGEYLMPVSAFTVLRGVLEDQQDAMIRETIEGGSNTIKWEDITLEKTLAALTATRISNRLTREIVELWCDAAIRIHTDKRAAEISEAKKHSPDFARLQAAATFNKYKENLAKLSAAVPNLGQEDAQRCEQFLLRSLLDDDIAKVLKKKLHAILNPAEASDDL